MSDEPTDAAIDADLKLTITGYDPRDDYPEWSSGRMRDAYRAGFEAGLDAAGLGN